MSKKAAPSVASNVSIGQVRIVPLDTLVLNENMRSSVDEEGIASLAASIKDKGLLQPLVVAADGKSLVAGYRRHAALRFLGYTSVPVIDSPEVKTEADIQMARGIENLQRENVTSYDVARHAVNLVDNHGYSAKMVAQRMTSGKGKSESNISNLVSAYRNVSPEIRRDWSENRCTTEVLFKVKAIKTAEGKPDHTAMNAKYAELTGMLPGTAGQKAVAAGTEGTEQGEAKAPKKRTKLRKGEEIRAVMESIRAEAKPGWEEKVYLLKWVLCEDEAEDLDDGVDDWKASATPVTEDSEPDIF